MPAVSSVRTDSYLTGFARDYKFNEGAWIADKIAPVKKVKTSSYKYKYYGTEGLRTEIDDIKGSRAGTNEVSYELGEGSGTILTRALKAFVSDEEIAQAADPVTPMEDAVVFVMSRLRLLHEMRLFTLMNATTNSTAVTDWDNASGVPLTDIMTYKGTMFTSIGKEPTHLVIGWHVANELSQAAGLSDKIKYQSFHDAAGLTGSGVAAMKPGGLEVVISSAVYDSADAGATASLAMGIGDAAYLVRVANGSRDCTWAIQPQCMDWVVTKWRDEDKGGWYVKVHHGTTIKEVTSGAIYEIDDVT